MTHVVTNPYLPSWEYVPDGEPHVFGSRVYLYGSHDKATVCGATIITSWLHRSCVRSGDIRDL